MAYLGLSPLRSFGQLAIPEYYHREPQGNRVSFQRSGDGAGVNSTGKEIDRGDEADGDMIRKDVDAYLDELIAEELLAQEQERRGIKRHRGKNQTTLRSKNDGMFLKAILENAPTDEGKSFVLEDIRLPVCPTERGSV